MHLVNVRMRYNYSEETNIKIHIYGKLLLVSFV